MDIIVIIAWFIVIIVTAFIEINTMDLTSIWFSIGALVSFVLAIIGLAIWWQVAAFLIISIALLLSVRPLAKNYLKTKVVSTNADRLIGKIAICTREIRPGERGEVKIDGQFWSAVTADEDTIHVEDRVEILAIEGVKLIVVKA